MGFLRRSKAPKGSSSPLLPSYDSICQPNDSKQPVPVSTDEKKPLSILASLRNNVTANHAAQSEHDAISRRAFVDKMVEATHVFLSDYRSSAHLKARLIIIPPTNDPDDGSSGQPRTPPSTEEFKRNMTIETTVFWDSSEASKAMARDLKARLEEELGDFNKTKQETNVELTVAAERQVWNRTRKNSDGRISTNWVLVVKVQIIDAKKRSK